MFILPSLFLKIVGKYHLSTDGYSVGLFVRRSILTDIAQTNLPTLTDASIDIGDE